MTYSTTITRDIDLEIEYRIFRGEADVGIPDGSIEFGWIRDINGNTVELTETEEERIIEEIQTIERDGGYDG